MEFVEVVLVGLVDGTALGLLPEVGLLDGATLGVTLLGVV